LLEHFHITNSDIPILISVGEKETAEFRRQSAEYFQSWMDKGNPGMQWIEKGENYFSLIKNLNDSNSSFCQIVVNFINGTIGS